MSWATNWEFGPISTPDSRLGAVRFESGDAGGAVTCFDRALAIQDDAAVRANRALALQRAARWQEAVDEYDCRLDASDLDAVERAEILSERSRSCGAGVVCAASGNIPGRGDRQDTERQ